MTSQHPDASIVIVSFNGKDLLRRCLRSVFDNLDASVEVIVVDNASSDGTPEMVRAEFPEVTLISRSQNGGFSRAANEGLATASGAYLMLLNPDTELREDPLQAMLVYLQEHPDVAVLAPKLLDSDGSLQLSCRAFPGLSTALFNRHSILTRVFGTNRFSTRYLMTDFDHGKIADVDWASAACWLVPRSAIEKLGPLDEGYFWTIEDVDFCQRVHRAGMRVVYFPEVEIIHHIGGSSSSAATQAINARHNGMWRYYRSHLRPANIVLRVVLDPLVWTGIQGRRLWKLASRRVT